MFYRPELSPRRVAEVRYDLTLDFPETRSAFRGSVKISGGLSSPETTLDARGLEILSAEVDRRPTPFEVDAREGLLRLREVPPGSGQLEIVFTGTIEMERPSGVYLTPLGGESAVTTHFEPAEARRAFPCFDRPDVKAVFSLEVTIPTGLVAISNMPIEHAEDLSDGRRRVRFLPTPPMSTYLLYLGIGPFEERELTIEGFRTISATARGTSAKTDLGLQAAGRSLRFFSDYYGIRYPLPKMHLVGIPKFISGAMENWGAIVASEPILLVQECNSMLNQMSMAITVTHEVGHQWFGDLVTMRKWDDLWLNESFATFSSYKAISALHPEWDAWEMFQAYIASVALMVDSLPGTHPIRVVVSDPTRAAEYFDDISYGKGASILRMIESFVGEAAFRRGVAQYLTNHGFGNAEAGDLWNALASASGRPIDRIMPEWILRPGYPCLTVGERPGSLGLSQKRFTLAGPIAERPWPIPLRLEVNGEPKQLLMDHAHLDVPIPENAEVLIDPGRTGFCRVRYEGRLARELVRRYQSLSPLDRSGFQSDQFAYLLAGEIGFPEYLEALELAASDTSPSVVFEVFVALTWARPLLARLPAVEEAFRRVFTVQDERLGPEPKPGETPATTAVRDPVARARVSLDPTYARSLKTRIADFSTLTPETREAMYMAYAATADPLEYADLLRRLRAAPPGLEGRIIAGGLGMLGRTEWLSECLNLVGSKEMELISWSRLMFTATWLNPSSGPAFWQFLTTGLEQHTSALQTGAWTMGLLLQCAIPVVGLWKPDALRRHLATHSFPQGEEGAKKGLAMLDALERALERAKAAGLQVRREGDLLGPS